MTLPTVDQVRELRARKRAATPGPWKWWTSCSWRRLRQAEGTERHVLLPEIARADGHPDLAVSEADMAFIALACNEADGLLDALIVAAREIVRMHDDHSLVRTCLCSKCTPFRPYAAEPLSTETKT